ncbi:hypothetical protein KR044_006968 [Drosophila immigrans]|nr:hypothetical protein KR044_006968 [Drosophila immigrans]
MNQKDLSGRLARWAIKLQGFEFTIQHRKGSENVVADTLSRLNEGVSELTESTGYSPYFLCFGQNMMLNGKDYDLLRKLKMVSDDSILQHPDILQLARANAKNNISKAHEVNARKYNLRSRVVHLKIGDTVYARSFAQSNASKKFSSKLAPVFINAKVYKKLSSSYYELQNEDGKSIGVYHLKDIQT